MGSPRARFRPRPRLADEPIIPAARRCAGERAFTRRHQRSNPNRPIAGSFSAGTAASTPEAKDVEL
jgi:hypothetical protein